MSVLYMHKGHVKKNGMYVKEFAGGHVQSVREIA